MKKIIRWSSRLTFILSFCFAKLHEDPFMFACLILRRFRLEDWLPNFINVRPKWFKIDGVYFRSDGNQIKSLRAKMFEHTTKHFRRQIDEWDISVEVGNSRKEYLAPEKPVYFITNSMPYTQSGYTLRTESISKIYTELGMELERITRFGYPLTIGKLPLMNASVKGLHYWRYPLRGQTRVELASTLLLKELRRLEATVCHTTTPFANAQVVSRAAREMEIPWIYEVRGLQHETWLSKMPEVLRDIAYNSRHFRISWEREVEAASKASAVICISQIIKDRLALEGIPEEKIFVLPNGIDECWLSMQLEPKKLRKELGLADEAILGVISSIVGYEGIDTLIRALARHNFSAKLLIVGDGEELPRLKRLTKELGKENRILFTGAIASSEIWKYYAAIDVLVIPRKDELVTRSVPPIKPLMAMAFAKPIVASDLPALREITGNKAFYFASDDEDDLVKKLEQAVEKGKSDELKWVARESTWGERSKVLLEVYSFLRSDRMTEG